MGLGLSKKKAKKGFGMLPAARQGLGWQVSNGASFVPGAQGQGRDEKNDPRSLTEIKGGWGAVIPPSKSGGVGKMSSRRFPSCGQKEKS